MAELLAPEVRELLDKTTFEETAFPYARAALTETASMHWQLVRQELVDEQALDSLRGELARRHGIEQRVEQHGFDFNEHINLLLKVLRVAGLHVLERVARKFE